MEKLEKIEKIIQLFEEWEKENSDNVSMRIAVKSHFAAKLVADVIAFDIKTGKEKEYWHNFTGLLNEKLEVRKETLRSMLKERMKNFSKVDKGE